MGSLIISSPIQYFSSFSTKHKLLVSRSSKIPLRLPLYSFPNSSRFLNPKGFPISKRQLSFLCYNGLNQEETRLDWPILKRWDVPWKWERVILTTFACGISFVLTGLVESEAISYLGLQIGQLSLDEKAELLFLGQALATAAVLGVLYGLTNTSQPLPDDIFRYDMEEPFNLQNGWLLWAGVGLIGAIGGIFLFGASMTFFGGNTPQRETDALVQLVPLIGSSGVSTACLLAVTGVLAPLLEETVFRGFLMASLTMWFPTPVSVLLSAALFSLAHLTPGEFPQLFLLGIALGFSYSQTRNLLTPITIHAIWNSGIILLLTFLQLQGYDIRSLLQAS